MADSLQPCNYISPFDFNKTMRKRPLVVFIVLLFAFCPIPSVHAENVVTTSESLSSILSTHSDVYNQDDVRDGFSGVNNQAQFEAKSCLSSSCTSETFAGIQLDLEFEPSVSVVNLSVEYESYAVNNPPPQISDPIISLNYKMSMNVTHKFGFTVVVIEEGETTGSGNLNTVFVGSFAPLENNTMSVALLLYHTDTDSSKDKMVSRVHEIYVKNGPLDSDLDGVPDDDDQCPNTGAEQIQNVLSSGCLLDSDQDGYSDAGDAFPSDATQWADQDSDGYGDNASGTAPDACPTESGTSTEDRLGCSDSDSDGYSDAGDAFPSDATQWFDQDSDGYGDNASGTAPDACPTTPGTSTIDRFGCLDSDQDGYSDANETSEGNETQDAGQGTNDGGDANETAGGNETQDVDQGTNGAGDVNESSGGDATQDADKNTDDVEAGEENPAGGESDDSVADIWLISMSVVALLGVLIVVALLGVLKKGGSINYYNTTNDNSRNTHNHHSERNTYVLHESRIPENSDDEVDHWFFEQIGKKGPKFITNSPSLVDDMNLKSIIADYPKKSKMISVELSYAMSYPNDWDLKSSKTQANSDAWAVLISLQDKLSQPGGTFVPATGNFVSDKGEVITEYSQILKTSLNPLKLETHIPLIRGAIWDYCDKLYQNSVHLKIGSKIAGFINPLPEERQAEINAWLKKPENSHCNVEIDENRVTVKEL